MSLNTVLKMILKKGVGIVLRVMIYSLLPTPHSPMTLLSILPMMYEPVLYAGCAKQEPTPFPAKGLASRW
jgi:hypothetical protein